MVNESDLLAEIVENPDEDEPRLIFADWLEERGDPQAEFIRVQCDLANGLSRHRRRALLKRESRLLSTHRKRWLGPLARDNITSQFHRGFLESVSLNGTSFAKFGAKRLSRLPTVRRLQIGYCRGDVGTQVVQLLAESTWNARLYELEIANSGLCDRDVIRLAGADHLQKLHTLNLSWNHGIGASGIEAIATSPWLNSLKVLDLHGIAFERTGIEAFLESRLAEQLRLLVLTQMEQPVASQLGKKLRSRFDDRLMYL